MKQLGEINFAVSENEWVSYLVELFVQNALESIKQSKKFYLAVSGGQTPNLFYKVIVNDSRLDKFTWENINIYWVDERTVPIDNENSNFGNALKYLKLVSANLFPMLSGDLVRIDADLKSYIQHLSTVPQVNGFPQFDLVLLGMGADGHIASLFPNTNALDNFSEWVVRNYIPQLKQERITITFPLITNAKEIVFLIKGIDKISTLFQTMSSQNTNFPVDKILGTTVKKTWIYYI